MVASSSSLVSKLPDARVPNMNFIIAEQILVLVLTSRGDSCEINGVISSGENIKEADINRKEKQLILKGSLVKKKGPWALEEISKLSECQSMKVFN